MPTEEHSTFHFDDISGDSEFLVSVSYAGEDRSLVSQVADGLAQRLTRDRVLYDRFHMGRFGRPNLDVYLPSLYQRSRLLVAFIGSHYASKEWCGLEWRVFRDLIKRNETDRIVLVRVDDGEVPGILSVDGYHDARQHRPEEIVDFIGKRLQLLHQAELRRPASLTKPGAFRFAFDRIFPRLHRTLTNWGTLPEPPELRYLRDYLQKLKAGVVQDIATKTYLPLRVKTVPLSSYADQPSKDPFVTPIHQVIREILGQAQGGDAATAEIAAVSRQSRQVRNILKVLRKTKAPLVLLGDPGTGKTMTLQETTLALVNSEIGRVFPKVTLYVRLGEFHYDGHVDENSVMEYVAKLAPRTIRNWLQELDWAGRLIILFDGMDEMSRVRYNEHTEALSQFAGSKIGQTKTLFSCRIADFTPKFVHTRLVLLPFNREQIEKFLRRHLPGTNAIEISGQSWKVPVLAKYLSRGSLPVDPTNPFVLWLICFFLQEEHRWPESRVQLLRFFNERNYERKSLEAAKEGIEFPNRDSAFSEWARFAYVITERNRGSAIPISALCEKVDDQASRHRVDLMVRIGKWCGVLAQSHQLNQVRFEHHRFQEFFCSLHVKNLANPLSWLDKLDAPRWQETMLNLVLLGGGQQAVQALLESISVPVQKHRAALLEFNEAEAKRKKALEESLLKHVEEGERQKEAETSKSNDELEADEEEAEEPTPSSRLKMEPSTESALADRVELCARIVHQGGKADPVLREKLLPPLKEAVGFFAEEGNPVSQVKMLSACHRIEDLDLMKALEKPLRSPVRWVRNQALQLLSSSDSNSRIRMSNLATEMAFDLATCQLVPRWRAYLKAVWASGGAGNWCCLLMATLCAMSQLLFLWGYLAVAYVGIPKLLSLPAVHPEVATTGLIDVLGSSLASWSFAIAVVIVTILGIRSSPRELWALLLGIGSALPSLTLLSLALWQGKWPVAGVAAGSIAVAALPASVLLTFIASLAIIGPLLGFLVVSYKARRGLGYSIRSFVSYSATECGLAWPWRLFAETAHDIIKEFIANRPRALKWAIAIAVVLCIAGSHKFGLTPITVAVFRFVGLPYKEGNSEFIFLVSVFCFSAVVLHVTRSRNEIVRWFKMVLPRIVANGRALVAQRGLLGCIKSFFRLSVQPLLAIGGTVAVCVIGFLILKHFGLWVARLVVAVIVLVCACLAAYEFWVLLRWLAYALRRTMYPPGTFSPAQWKTLLKKADAYWQEDVLLRTNHQSVGLSPSDYLSLIRDVEPLIIRDPALSAYWEQRHKLEEALRQERSG